MRAHRSLTRTFTLAGAATGVGHLRHGTPCQDRALGATPHPHRACVVVCDGAGSAPLSHHGAQAVTEDLAAWLPSNHDLLLRASPSDAAEIITQRALHVLQRRADDLGAPPHHLACTLAFASLQPSGALLGNLGDGAVVGLASDRALTLLPPERGEFASTTTFLTSPQAAQRLRLLALPPDAYDGFAAFTDGAAASLLEHRTLRPASILYRLPLHLRTHPPDGVRAVLDEDLLPALIARTHDDCSIALLHRLTLPLTDLPHLPAPVQRALLQDTSPHLTRRRRRRALEEALRPRAPRGARRADPTAARRDTPPTLKNLP